MVAVYINVEDALICLEKLKYPQHAIVNIAEARGFELLCVVEPSRPVNSYVGIALRNLIRCHQCSGCISLTVIVHKVKDWAISILFREAEPMEVILISLFVLVGHVLDAVYVVITVEFWLD